MSSKYKQIGNAVPVNLAWAIGRSLIRLFNQIEMVFPKAYVEVGGQEYNPVIKLHGIFEDMACDKPASYKSHS